MTFPQSAFPPRNKRRIPIPMVGRPLIVSLSHFREIAHADHPLRSWLGVCQHGDGKCQQQEDRSQNYDQFEEGEPCVIVLPSVPNGLESMVFVLSRIRSGLFPVLAL